MEQETIGAAYRELIISTLIFEEASAAMLNKSYGCTLTPTEKAWRK
ncbi:MAG: hypothetical protein ACRCZZ_07650 [Phocaeicola sp.]